MKTLVIDCNTNNTWSVTRALERAGSDIQLCRHPEEIKGNYTHIVLPGIGTFERGMENLKRQRWDSFLLSQADVGTPILGICLGMQMLASAGAEGGASTGLGLIPGRVVRLEAKVPSEKVPHAGWNDVHYDDVHPLLLGIPSGTDFYFVHSYHFEPDVSAARIGTTDHCGAFTSVVRSKNVYGVQFHPEKSGKPGLKLLENFLGIPPC